MKQKRMVMLRRLLAVAISTAALLALLPLGSSADTVTVTTSVATVLTFGIDDSSADLGTLTPGTPVTGTTVLTVDTNNANGYYLQTRYTTTNCSGNVTLCHTGDTTTEIADKTDFDGVGTCAVTATYSGTGLGFTVFAADTGKNTTCWGTGTTVTHASNKYAGFPPTTAKTILTVSAGPKADDDTSVGYKLDVASTQKSGAYGGSAANGAVEFTATGN